MPFGHEVIIDMHNCKAAPFCRKSIAAFCANLCSEIKMERGPLHFWDYESDPKAYAKAPPHLKGISAVQFIMTGNIIIYTLDDLRHVYFNIFSCKSFDRDIVCALVVLWTKGTMVTFEEIIRS